MRNGTVKLAMPNIAMNLSLKVIPALLSVRNTWNAMTAKTIPIASVLIERWGRSTI
jgi:hypothetical protein